MVTEVPMKSAHVCGTIFLENINSITLKFLITGHTQNEGVHVHSVIAGAIKKFKKSSSIYVPDHYVTIIKQAKKRGKPYRVHEMSFSDFFDLKLMAQEIGIKDVFKNEDGEIVQLSKICAVKVTKDNPEELFYKTSFKENDFRSLVVTKSKRQCMPLKSNPILKPVYKKRLASHIKRKQACYLFLSKTKKAYPVCHNTTKIFMKIYKFYFLKIEFLFLCSKLRVVSDLSIYPVTS
nr:unnamed protein product [Callosobruchus analis]